MMRIIVFILNALIQLAAAAAGFILLLLGMNGFGERDATPGLYLYIAVNLAGAAALGLGSAFVAGRLVKKRAYSGLAASAVAVLGFSVLGGLVLVVSFFAALIVADTMRGMR